MKNFSIINIFFDQCLFFKCQQLLRRAYLKSCNKKEICAFYIAKIWSNDDVSI